MQHSSLTALFTQSDQSYQEVLATWQTIHSPEISSTLETIIANITAAINNCEGPTTTTLITANRLRYKCHLLLSDIYAATNNQEQTELQLAFASAYVTTPEEREELSIKEAFWYLQGNNEESLVQAHDILCEVARLTHNELLKLEVQLVLGILYHKLGHTQAAQEVLTHVANQTLSSDLAQEAQIELDKITH